MKVTMEYNLPDEQWELNRALESAKVTFFLQEYYNYLRNKVKYTELSEAESNVYNDVYEHFLSMLNEEKIDVFDEV